MRLFALWIASLAALLFSPAAAAQAEGSAPNPGGSGSSSVLLAPKVGLFKGTNDLGGHLYVGLEVGYLTSLLDSRLAFVLEGTWHRGLLNGTLDGTQVPGGSDTFGMAERQVGLMLSAVYRERGLVPGVLVYGGGGPGLFLNHVTTSAFGSVHVEQQTTAGFQLQLGLEYPIGPGGIFVETQYRFTNVELRSTGPASLGGFLVGSVGYRLALPTP